MTPFRECEVKYRLKPLATTIANPSSKKKNRTGRIRYEKTDFSDVIDFDEPVNEPERVITLENKGGKLPPGAQIFAVRQVPGFVVIRNGLTAMQQLEWSTRCLTEYSNAEHTNLTNLKAKNNDDFWKHCCDNNDLKPFGAMRWSSLGYHYDWTKREYTADNKSTFPPELNRMASEFAKAVGYAVDAEAAIVNYYPLTSSMGGHLDDAELTKLPPIVSISLGNAAIFLIGGRTRDTKPAAVWLRSGDVAIMGGESRLCYHAVPRIVADTIPEELKKLAASPEAKAIPGYNDFVWQYLQTARLNINSRQVVDENNATFAPRWPPAPLHALQMEAEKKAAAAAAAAATGASTVTAATSTATATTASRTHFIHQ